MVRNRGLGVRKRRQSGDAAVVRRVLHHYASRGVFRSFSEVPGRRGALAFRFLWYRDLDIRVTVDLTARRIVFRDLLPAVPARSAMDRALRAYVAGRCERSVVAHRRADPRKVTVGCVNRASAISLAITLKGPHTEYGVHRAVNLAHGVLIEFLGDGQWAAYQVEHMRGNTEEW